MTGQVEYRHQTRRIKRRTEIKLLLVFVVVICLAAMYGRAQMQTKVDSQVEQVTLLNRQIADQELYSEELARFTLFTKTKLFIEEMARQLGFVYPDEIIFREEGE